MKVSQFRNEIRAPRVLAHRYQAFTLQKERINLRPFQWINVIWHSLWSPFFSLILRYSIRPVCWELWEEAGSKRNNANVILLLLKYPAHLHIQVLVEIAETAGIAIFFSDVFLRGGLICIAWLKYTCMQQAGMDLSGKCIYFAWSLNKLYHMNAF